LSGTLDDPGPYIDDLPAQGFRITGDGYNISADVFLEGFVKVEGQDHAMKKGSIGPKLGEGQLFAAKVLEGPEGQLACSPFMVTPDETLRTQEPLQIGPAKLFVHGISLPYVGIDHLTGPGKGQENLAGFAHGPGKYGPAELVPVLAPIPEFEVFPDLIAVHVSRTEVFLPAPARDGGHGLGNILNELAPAYIADLQLLEHLENLLVHESGIHMDHYGHILVIAGADAFDHSADHTLHALAGVAVFFSGAQHRIHQQAIPGQLQGVEAFALFIGGLDSFSLFGLIVVHDHGIQIQDDGLRLGDGETPNEYGQIDIPEAPDQGPGEGLKEPLDCMGGDQVCRVGLDDPGIGLILFQLIEIGQMPACTVYEKSKDLLENFVNRSPFLVFAQLREPRKQDQIKDPDLIQISNKQAQSASTGDCFVSSFYATDFAFAARLIFAMLAHKSSTFEVQLSLRAFCLISPLYQKVTQMWRTFYGL